MDMGEGKWVKAIVNAVHLITLSFDAQRRRVYTEFDDLGEEKGNWSDWETIAECSRTCGGGVTYRQRTCLEEPCIGPTRIYSSCNTQDCPEGAKAQELFLQSQCARMNSIPYDGAFYSWIPRRRQGEFFSTERIIE